MFHPSVQVSRTLEDWCDELQRVRYPNTFRAQETQLNDFIATILVNEPDGRQSQWQLERFGDPWKVLQRIGGSTDSPLVTPSSPSG